MRIALVHDYLNEFGGAERVLLALSEIWPDATIYTAFYRNNSQAWERFKDKKVKVSWVHQIPFFSKYLHSPLRFLAPLIWKSFDFSRYDIVISSASWYVTKGFGTRGTSRKKPIEICYCHTPPRWLYGYQTSIEFQRYWLVRVYAAIVGHFMRLYDFQAAQRVDYFIANSKNVAARIRKFYRREAAVVYPPAEIVTSDKKQVISSKNSVYYLVVARIVGGKGLKLAVEAANRLGFHLKVVGQSVGYGAEFQELQKSAKDNVEFLGYVKDSELAELYAGARAFLALATDEDFGITPVEAMMAGTPVIAFRGGGYLETVVEGKTGIFFNDPTVESLVGAIKKFEKMKFNSDGIKNHAQKFSNERFKKEIKRFVKAAV